MRYTRLFSVLLACSLITGCGSGEISENSSGTNEAPTSETDDISADNDSEYTAETNLPSEIKTVDDIKKKTSVFSNECRINLGDTISISGQGAWILENGDISITESGVYTVSGTGDCGIVIEAEDSVKLVLNNAELMNNDGAAVFATSGRLILEAAEGTENILSDGSDYIYTDAENAPNATVFAKDDILITGTGKITVNASYNNGIYSKDSLAAETATVVVNSENNALKANDSVYIESGTFTLTSGGDSIKTDNAEIGNIALMGGDITLISEQDGIQADNELVIGGGNINITTTGDTEADSDLSSKGIKSERSITIGGGNIIINSTDHSIRSFGTVSIDGGTITADSEYGKGIFAHDVLTINNGTVDVQNSCKGLDSKSDIVINGGTVLTSDTTSEE